VRAGRVAQVDAAELQALPQEVEAGLERAELVPQERRAQLEPEVAAVLVSLLLVEAVAESVLLPQRVAGVEAEVEFLLLAVLVVNFDRRSWFFVKELLIVTLHCLIGRNNLKSGRMWA